MTLPGGRLLEHTLPPDQQDFAAPVVESLPLGDCDPDRLSVAIVVEGIPVGMFALDRGGYFREFDDDPSVVRLRGFYIAPEHQSNGYGTEAVSATGAVVRQRLPDVKRWVLTVNHRDNQGRYDGRSPAGFVLHDGGSGGS